jgi:hypothetical protein
MLNARNYHYQKLFPIIKFRFFWTGKPVIYMKLVGAENLERLELSS